MNRDIQSYANVWAVPCDGVSDCENGEDEHESTCNIPEELTLFSLTGVFSFIFITMLVSIVYHITRYGTQLIYLKMKQAEIFSQLYD